MAFAAVIIITFVAVFALFVVFAIRRHRKHKQRFESVRMFSGQNNIDGFISEIDADIEQANDAEHVKFLQINKTTGMFYKGEWAAASTLLESIDPSAMPTEFRTLYYNNLLDSKLMLGEIEAANQLYAGHLASLAYFIPHHDLTVAVVITIGALDYYNEEIPKSKLSFEFAMFIARSPQHKAIAHYFLALIAIDENDQFKAMEHFDEAMATGIDTWISEFAQNHIISFEESSKATGVVS